MSLNLEVDIGEQINALDPERWSPLQAEICLNIANAKFSAFIMEAENAAELVRLGLVARAVAADHLHTAAVYNHLYFEYGAEAIQGVMAEAMVEACAGDS